MCDGMPAFLRVFIALEAHLARSLSCDGCSFSAEMCYCYQLSSASGCESPPFGTYSQLSFDPGIRAPLAVRVVGMWWYSAVRMGECPACNCLFWG